MKKLLCVFLVISMFLSLVACGGESADDNTSAESSSSGKSSSSNEASSSSKPSSSNNSSASSKPSSSSKASSSSVPTVLPTDIEQPQFPVSSEDVYSNYVIRYKLNDECMGYYFAPKKQGKYPTVIIMHGQGTVDNFKKRLVSSFNNWVKSGYLPPMVVVLPEVLMTYAPGQSATESEIEDFQYYIYKSRPNRFNALLTSIETGALCSRIDTSIAPYVSGFSMGGMAALHAGVEYNTRIKKVGSLSPAKAFYLGDGKWGIYNYARDIKFSEEPDARVYLCAGQAERDFEGKPGFTESLRRYETAIKVNNESILTTFVAPSSWGGHSFALAQKEIFMFLYFAAFDKLPPNELVEAICNNPDDYKMPSTAYSEDIYNK